jgi:uncharacterized protein
MTTVEQHPSGTNGWVDLMSADTAAARDFYSAVLGWTYEISGPDMGFYTQAQVRGLPAAGLGSPPPGLRHRDIWTTYVLVDDVGATVARALGAGATVVVEPMAVGDAGSMALILDPTGGALGLWQPGEHQGAKVVNEPGAYIWGELVTSDAAKARAFYGEVFDWTFKQVGDGEAFDYTTVHRTDDHELGGIMQAASGEDKGPHWEVYFGVADTDAAVGRAQAAGGTVTSQASDSPFGRLAGLADPGGAEFRVISVTEVSDQA